MQNAIQISVLCRAVQDAFQHLVFLPAIITHIQVMLHQRHQLRDILPLRRKPCPVFSRVPATSIVFAVATSQEHAGQTRFSFHIHIAHLWEYERRICYVLTIHKFI